MAVIRIPGRGVGGGPAPVPISFEAAAAPGRALAQVGAGLQDLARRGVQQQKEKRDNLDYLREQAALAEQRSAGRSAIDVRRRELIEDPDVTAEQVADFEIEENRNLFAGLLEGTTDPRLRAQIEGTLQGIESVDRSALVDAADRDINEFALFAGQGVLRSGVQAAGDVVGMVASLADFGTVISRVRSDRPDLAQEADKAASDAAVAFRAEMFRRGEEALYWRMLATRELDNRLRAQTEGQGFPANSVFDHDTTVAMGQLQRLSEDKLESSSLNIYGAVRETGPQKGVFDRYVADIDSLGTENFLGLPGDQGAIIRQNALSTEDNANRSRDVLNGWVDYFEGVGPPLQPGELNDQGFARVWNEQILAKAKNPSTPLDERVDIFLDTVRDLPTVPQPVANTISSTIEAARGAGEFDQALFEASATAFLVLDGATTLTELAGDSISGRLRQDYGVAQTKTVGVLTPEQIDFLSDFFANRGAGVPLDAAVDNAREAQKFRIEAGQRSRSADDVLQKLLGFKADSGMTMERFAKETLQKEGGPYRDLEATPFLGDKLRRLLETEAAKLDPRVPNAKQSAVNRAFLRLKTEEPPVTIFGRTRMDGNLYEKTKDAGTAWLEMDIVTTIADLPNRLEKPGPDATAEERRRFASEKARFDALASRLDEPAFLERLEILTLRSNDKIATLYLNPEGAFEPGKVPELGDLLDGTIDDPATGLPLQIELDYEKSELRKIRAIEGALIEQGRLSEMDHTVSSRIERGVGGDLLDEYEAVLAGLDDAWMLTPRQFMDRYFTGTPTVGPFAHAPAVRAEAKDVDRFLSVALTVRDPDQPMFMSVDRYREAYERELRVRGVSPGARGTITAEPIEGDPFGRRALRLDFPVTPGVGERESREAVRHLIMRDNKGRSAAERLAWVLAGYQPEEGQ